MFDSGWKGGMMRLPSTWPERAFLLLETRRRLALPADSAGRAFGWLVFWLACWLACWLALWLVLR
jgi:hypothetical protein